MANRKQKSRRRRIPAQPKKPALPFKEVSAEATAAALGSAAPQVVDEQVSIEQFVDRQHELQAPKFFQFQTTNGFAAEECKPPEPIEPDLIEREEYKSERKMLIEMQTKQADQHDNSILKFSAGALALTITFLEKIAPEPAQETKHFIGRAWLFFLLSMVLMMMSFLTSQKALMRQIAIAGNLLMRMRGSTSNWWGKFTGNLNIVSYFFFVVGVAHAAWFAWVNFEKPKPEGVQVQVADQKKPAGPTQPIDTIVYPKKIEGGYVPPAAPASPPPSGTRKDTPPKKGK